MPMWNGLLFQDSCSYSMEQLIYFHDYAMFVLVFVMFMVFYSIFSCFSMSIYNSGISESHGIEFIWTILPALLLIFIALPSLKILYLIDEEFYISLIIKVIGHQWYWSYEASDLASMSSDYYLSSSKEFRVLDSGDHLFCPFMVSMRFIVTSQDVIHAWTIPVMGVKCDALPGRLNQLIFLMGRPGLFFGQCSELCGANHSFMPISLESISPSDYCTNLF